LEELFLSRSGAPATIFSDWQPVEEAVWPTAGFSTKLVHKIARAGTPLLTGSATEWR
jgi:hypothetical protein